MINLKQLLAELSIYTETSYESEIAEAVNLIILAQEIYSRDIDTIHAAFKNGPLCDGDVPSKSARDRAINAGLIVKVVVKGEDGFNALTHKGYAVHKILQKLYSV